MFVISSMSFFLNFVCKSTKFDMSAQNLYYTLDNGTNIPMVGLGTACLNGPDVALRVLNHALAMGYRLIDTASIYENEKDIGYALEKLLPRYNLTRRDIFITTKLHPNLYGENTFWSIINSLKLLNCGYIDLYLINWPGAGGISPTEKANSVLRDLSWQKMIQAMKRKILKQIGVSSYTVRHLKELLAKCRGVKPVVNQVEFHPFCRDRKLLDFCHKENIFVQAYGSLGGNKWSDVLDHEVVNNCAFNIGKTPAQILLRWAVQQNVGIIPSSQTRGHLFSNMQLNYTIPEEDMVKLSTIHKYERYDTDPNTVL